MATKRWKIPILHNPTIRNTEGSWAWNNTQKAHRFQSAEEEDPQDWTEPGEQDVVIRNTSTTDVSDEIKRHESQKASGFDHKKP